MFDIAINHKTGDWVFAANADFQGVSGLDVVQQRILTRLRMVRGWELDPTNGTLGSRLTADLRLPRGRAVRELPLAVREALAPMDDISVQDVVVTQESRNSIRLHINYVSVDPSLENFQAEQLARSVVFQVGV